MSPVVRSMLLLTVLPFVGALAFYVVEDMPFFDSLYMAVITLTTVGFAEVKELSNAGRVVVMIYLVVGLGVFLSCISVLGEAVVRGQLQRVMNRRNMDSVIKSLSGHHIICGFGRMGFNLAEALDAKKQPFVIVDRDTERLELARTHGWPVIVGDATDDQVLKLARIEHASAMATVLSGDADNLYVVLSARLLNSGLKILSRATDEKSIEKIERAGADKVISVYHIGARRMALLMLNPNMVDFIEVLTSRNLEFEIAQFTVPETADYCDCDLSESNLRERGINVLSISHADGRLDLLPGGTAQIHVGDTLTIVGKNDAVEELAGMARE